MIAAGLRSESLRGAVGLLAGREIVEEEELCLNLRGRAEHCRRCADACHSGALDLSPDALEVDREVCTGCGGCVPACPAGALRLTGFSPARFLDTLAGGEEVHLHCSGSADGGGGVVVPCFKALDERLLAAARADGTEILVLHGLDRCAACRHGGALREVARMRLRLGELLGAAAPRLQSATGDAEGDRGERQRRDQPPLSRRAFLRFAGARAAESATEWLVPAAEEDGQDLPFFQDDPEAIRQPHPYLSPLAARAGAAPWAAGAVLPWRLRSLAQHCTACLACGQRCPTGALLGTETGAARSISFEPALCTDCGLCEALCPVDAVRSRPALDPAEATAPRGVLMLRTLRLCDHCGTPFLLDEADAAACPVCTNERELDDEWLAMLEG